MCKILWQSICCNLFHCTIRYIGWITHNGPVTRYAKSRVTCAGNVFGATHFNRKPLVSDPGMHHGTCITLTCITLVPWCVSGSLTRGGGERVPGIPGSYATRNFAYLVRGPCRRLYRALAQNTQYGSRYVLCKPDRPVTEFDYPWEATLCISYLSSGLVRSKMASAAMHHKICILHYFLLLQFQFDKKLFRKYVTWIHLHTEFLANFTLKDISLNIIDS